MGIGWMPQEVEVVIIHLENKGKVQLQYQNMEPIKKVYVEMVRKVVESEERENENAE